LLSIVSYGLNRVRTFRVEVLHLHQQSSGGQAPRLALRESVVLIGAAALLVVYHYYGKAYYFDEHFFLPLLESGHLDGLDAEWYPLLGYSYWAVAGLLIRVLVPILLILFLLRENPLDFGLRLRGMLKHTPLYLLLFMLMLPVLYAVSTTEAFQLKYPFYKGAVNGTWHFVWFEICYGIQFFSLEFFFRGFMTFGLYKRFGYYALLIMTIPYCLIHFGKPLPETIGAIGAGLLLGFLALRTGSVYLGTLLHWGVGLTMDALALYQVSNLENS
jgi:membrane protease YdiL (CAAX protease family)